MQSNLELRDLMEYKKAACSKKPQAAVKKRKGT